MPGHGGEGSAFEQHVMTNHAVHLQKLSRAENEVEAKTVVRPQLYFEPTHV